MGVPNRALLLFIDIHLTKLNVPVRVVQETLPRLVLLLRQLQVEQRTSLGLFRLADQRHVSLLRSATTLADVAIDASTNDILPSRLPTLATRQYVVQRQFRSGELLAAVLALIAIPSEDVSTIELHRLLRYTIVIQQSNDSRSLDFHTCGSNPIVFFLTKMLCSKFADFLPSREVIGRELTVLQRNDFGQFLYQETECSTNGDDVYSHEHLVQNQNTCIQRRVSRGIHKRLAFLLKTEHLMEYKRAALVENDALKAKKVQGKNIITGGKVPMQAPSRGVKERFHRNYIFARYSRSFPSILWERGRFSKDCP
jgi:hypothetical protein